MGNHEKQFLDENDELLIDENLLDISVGFISGDLDTLDILQIFDQSPSTITAQLESIKDDGEFSSAVNTSSFWIKLSVSFSSIGNSGILSLLDSDFISFYIIMTSHYFYNTTRNFPNFTSSVMVLP